MSAVQTQQLEKKVVVFSFRFFSMQRNMLRVIFWPFLSNFLLTKFDSSNSTFSYFDVVLSILFFY